MKHKLSLIISISLLSILMWRGGVQSAAIASTAIRFAGPFQNTSLGIGGTVIIDMNISPTTVSGYINFTNDPDVGSLCGAGSFNGTRSGNNFSFSFTSNDSDPGCGIVNGTTLHIAGSFSEGNITNGQFSHPSSGQSGNFSAKQTTHYVGTFNTNGYPGTVTIDLATNSSSLVTGYMNFTNNPGVPALCGAGSFRGSLNSSGLMSYDFLSNDPDSGCGFDDGLEFAVSAILDGLSITNGSYTVVNTGQVGTFSTACGGGNSISTGIHPDDICPADTTDPEGRIIWPYDTYINPSNSVLANEPYLYGPGDIVRIEAVASDGFSGVDYVSFWVKYDGEWHRIKNEYFPPYEADFQIPNNLQSPDQLIQIGIHVVDKAGNYVIDPEGDPEGLRYVTYNEDFDNPGVIKNWVPAGNRAYLNQRSLSPDGDSKCGASSATMVLAMRGKILTDYDHLASTANAIYPNTISNGQILIGLVAAQMTANQLPSQYNMTSNANDQWCMIRNEIGDGRPVVMLSWNVTPGHFFTIVGYKEDTNTSSRELIVYDPYGEWLGSIPNNYNRNVSIHDENPPVPPKDSRNGQWVYYDFEATRSSWTIVSTDADIIAPCEENNRVMTATPTTPPDLISDEPDNFGYYEGVDIVAEFEIYLPALIK